LLKIIIADADNEIVKEVSDVLSKYQPEWHRSITCLGKACLDNLKNNPDISLVITGKQLTDMPGFELIRYIRDDYDIPIVFISSDNDIRKLVKAFDIGVNDFIKAPFNKQLFIAKLKCVLRDELIKT
jgi:PleD family two-component response regulator